MQKKINNNCEYSSFRDPSGYVFYEDGKVFRRINECYIELYDLLMTSGLYDELVNLGMLVKHKEIKREKDFILLEVEKIPFISYPYEWCFDEYRDAAILTLKINLVALKYNMILKDASAYNVQFLNGKPIFIDTLSFDKYDEGKPWGAYGQFTRHFLAPLLLMNNIDERLNSLMKNFIDGIPLDLTASMLKKRGGMITKQHIIWQNKAIQKHQNDGKNNNISNVNISKKSLESINIMMQNQISTMSRKKVQTEWDTYYDNTNYTSNADISKQKIVEKFLYKIKNTKKDIAIDLGANDGKYSRLISEKFLEVLSMDIDYNSVNRNYINSNGNNILPLVFDFNNPSPAIGFACQERESLIDRSKAKLVLALALIHHIAISNNVPFNKIALWLSELTEYLIIEFVPKEDSQVQILLRTRNDIFNNYTIEEFENDFAIYFEVLDKEKIDDSERVIYLMKRI